MDSVDIEKMILIVGFAKRFIAIYHMRINSDNVGVFNTIIHGESLPSAQIVLPSLDVGFLKGLFHRFFGWVFAQK